MLSSAISQDCETGFIPINERCYFEQDIILLVNIILNN